MVKHNAESKNKKITQAYWIFIYEINSENLHYLEISNYILDVLKMLNTHFPKRCHNSRMTVLVYVSWDVVVQTHVIWLRLQKMIVILFIMKNDTIFSVYFLYQAFMVFQISACSHCLLLRNKNLYRSQRCMVHYKTQLW